MPSFLAMSSMEPHFVQLWHPAALHMTGFDRACPPQRLEGFWKECRAFWLHVTYSRLSRRLLEGLPSLWCTCHAWTWGGSPWKLNLTKRWTRKLCPEICTERYPDARRLPQEIPPLVLQQRPSELTCQNFLSSPKCCWGLLEKHLNTMQGSSNEWKPEIRPHVLITSEAIKGSPWPLGPYHPN